MTELQPLLESLNKHYHQHQLLQSDFLEIVLQLQPFNPLVNYINQQFFKQSYQQLIKQGPVTLPLTLQFISYLCHKNKDVILKNDMQFYEQLISKLMEDNITTISSYNFSNALVEKKTLNQSLKYFIMKFFQKQDVIEVKKLRKLIYQIYNQLQNKGKLQIINSLRSSSLPTKKSSTLSQFNVDTLRQTSQLIQITKQYFSQYKQFMQNTDIALQNSEDKQKLQSFKNIHQVYTGMQKETKQRMNDKIRSLQLSNTDKQEEINQLNEKMQEMKEDMKEMDEEFLKLQRNIQFLQKQKKFFQNRLVEKSKQNEQLISNNASLRQRIAKVVNENKSLQQQLSYEIKFRQGNNLQQSQDQQLSKSKDLLERLSANNFDMEQLSLKQELDDAQQRLYRISEKHQLQMVEIQEHYKLKIQQLQNKIISLEKQLKIPKTLQNEGLRQSAFRWSKRVSEVQTLKLPRPPQLNISFSLNKLIQSRISILPIDLDIKQQAIKPSNQNSVIPTVPDIKVNVQDFYKYDYCDVSEVDAVEKILQKQRQQCEYEPQHLEKRHLFLSCDVKLLKQNGDHFNFYILVGPMKIYFISGSKHTVKDEIPINEIAKIILPPNSQFLILRCGRQNDILLATNRRKQLVLFLKNAASYQSLTLCIIRANQQKSIQIRQHKKKILLINFRGLINSPYFMSFQYSLVLHAMIETKGVFNQNYIRECFVAVNQAGIFVFEDDFITSKSIWKQKLIIFIPMTPLLILGRLQKKRLRIGFQQKYKDHKDVILSFKSSFDEQDLILKINEYKRRTVQIREDKEAEQKKTLNYIQISR